VRACRPARSSGVRRRSRAGSRSMSRGGSHRSPAATRCS
jgi:hypothetical protein